jgi:hypothetical protein
MIHCVAHVDNTDATLVVCMCGLIVHVNDPSVQLLEHDEFLNLDSEVLVTKACPTCMMEVGKNEDDPQGRWAYEAGLDI